MEGRQAAKRPKQAKLVTGSRLRDYVEQRLPGKIWRLDGTVIDGPLPPQFTGRNKPPRKERAWVSGWSPEQINNQVKTNFPDDDSMRISHETIYQSLFIETRDALNKEASVVFAHQQNASEPPDTIEAQDLSPCHRGDIAQSTPG